MNPRPILITLCGAVAFVALCYFGGKQVFEQGHIKDTSLPTVPKYQGQVDNTPEPATHPTDPPATNSEQITHVTPQPALTVNTEIHNTTQEAETPTTTSLYIGRAGAGEDAGPFGSRFNRQQYVEKYCAKGGQREEISIRIGRVRCKKYTGYRYWTWPDSDWIPLVRDAEAILIHHHYDQLDNQRREKWHQSLSIENTGDFGSLGKWVSYEVQQ